MYSRRQHLGGGSSTQAVGERLGPGLEARCPSLPSEALLLHAGKPLCGRPSHGERVCRVGWQPTDRLVKLPSSEDGDQGLYLRGRVSPGSGCMSDGIL